MSRSGHWRHCANVPSIAAEDTRLTHRLLARHGVDTRMTSYHARSDPSRAAALLDHLRGGADLALVTDAGTPTVSDPGADLGGGLGRRGWGRRAYSWTVGGTRRCGGIRDCGPPLDVRGLPAQNRT